MTTEKVITGSWLPVFPGFYGTMLEWVIDNTYDNDIEYINEHIEPEALRDAMHEHFYESKAYYARFPEIEKEISIKCTSIIEDELKKLGMVESIEFETLESPKEYNFRNDSVNCIIRFSEENMKKITEYIKEHTEEWAGYLKEHYKSYDGFISFHDYFTDSSEWQFPDVLSAPHHCGAVLNFICENEGMNSETLYYGLESAWIDGIDLDKLKQECIDNEWWIPDTWFNRMKAKWRNWKSALRFRIVNMPWDKARQYILETRKQRYIFCVYGGEFANTKPFIVKRFFKVFVFAKLKEGKTCQKQ